MVSLLVNGKQEEVTIRDMTGKDLKMLIAKHGVKTLSPDTSDMYLVMADAMPFLITDISLSLNSKPWKELSTVERIEAFDNLPVKEQLPMILEGAKGLTAAVEEKKL